MKTRSDVGIAMKEIGGYIEIEHNRGNLYHDNAIKLNCGRACLEYLIKAYEIRKIWLPFFLCDSVIQRCNHFDVSIGCYTIGDGFSIHIPSEIKEDEWLYVVNYYGQLSVNDIERLRKVHERIIVDNAQAYYEHPVVNVPTIYTCRKFFGVSDGAFLYTKRKVDFELETDVSYNRMEFLLGRFERGASVFYDEYVKNNEIFAKEPMKKMSALTENILRGLDHEYIKKARTDNWRILHEHLNEYNGLKLKNTENAFAYPLLVKNGREMRNILIGRKIYIPLLWPNVLSDCPLDSVEYELADNILPLPCDQRYKSEDMNYLAEQLIDLIRRQS